MKVVALNGSPRENGNTAMLIGLVFAELNKEGVETELIQLGGREIRGCRACMKCFERRDGHCVMDDDILNELMDKVSEADGIIIGSPTYFCSVSAEVKAFLDRAGLVAIANGRCLKRKVGAAVVAVRRAGASNVFDTINKFFFINEMIVPGSIYWNLGIGFAPGEVNDDDEGVRTMRHLGENMAWLMKRVGQKAESRE
jgi:multimeric flavodoxin WrbA